MDEGYEFTQGQEQGFYEEDPIGNDVSSGDELLGLAEQARSQPFSARAPSASVVPRKGLKRPMLQPYEDEEDSADQPDLHEYFGNWNMPAKDIILMCRSYASYVSQSSKSRTKK